MHHPATDHSAGPSRNTPLPPPLLPRGAAAQCQLIVKLGGAAITDKAAAVETLRPAELAAAADAIAAAVAARPPGSVVVVHGAGSFGHHTASQYGVAYGGSIRNTSTSTTSTSGSAGEDGAAAAANAATARRGFALTRATVMRLNGHVVAALLERGVPAVGMSPCGAWTCSNRSLHEAAAGVAAVEAVLTAGMVPVLHGDAVLDMALGCTILSGDTILRHLAEVHRPQCVLFMTNVHGIYDRPPEEAGAQLVPEIAVAADGSWWPIGTSSSAKDGSSGMRLSAAAHDTTGGMAMKVQEAAATAAMGVSVVIAKAGSAAALAACLRGAQGVQECKNGTAGGSNKVADMACTVVRAASAAELHDAAHAQPAAG